MMADDEGQRLSLIIGGPFHGFLQRLRLLGPDRLPGFRAAAILAAISWLLPASLAVIQAVLTGDRQPLGFFSDPSATARFAVAVFALVFAERKADARITLVIDSFRTMRLVTGDEGVASLEIAIRCLEQPAKPAASAARKGPRRIAS